MTHMECACIQMIEWFDVSNTSDPLVGDLLEERHSGRSRWWLMRQVLVAVGGSVIREIVGNKLLSLRAIVAGVVVVMPLAAVFKRLAYFSWANGPLQFCFLNGLTFVVAGAAVGHKFPKHRAAMVTAFMLYALAARASLVGFNVHQFFSPSHPFRDLAYAAVTIFAPFFTLIGTSLLFIAQRPRHEHLECEGDGSCLPRPNG
jgi:hypothetical protein